MNTITERSFDRVKDLIEEGWDWDGALEGYIYPRFNDPIPDLPDITIEVEGGPWVIRGRVYDPVAYWLIRFHAWSIGHHFSKLRGNG